MYVVKGILENSYDQVFMKDLYFPLHPASLTRADWPSLSCMFSLLSHLILLSPYSHATSQGSLAKLFAGGWQNPPCVMCTQQGTECPADAISALGVHELERHTQAPSAFTRGNMCHHLFPSFLSLLT